MRRCWRWSGKFRPRHRQGARPPARDPRSGRHHLAPGRPLRDDPQARTGLAHHRAAVARDGHRPARPRGARMRHRCLGQIRAGDARRRRCRLPPAKIDHRRGPAGGEAARRRETPADHLRRRRAGRVRRSHRALRHAAGAGARLSARPRRARQPRSAERDAAARPRSVGRGRRRARGRHAALIQFTQWGIDASSRSSASMPIRGA